MLNKLIKEKQYKLLKRKYAEIEFFLNFIYSNMYAYNIDSMEILKLSVTSDIEIMCFSRYSYILSTC